MLSGMETPRYPTRRRGIILIALGVLSMIAGIGLSLRGYQKAVEAGGGNYVVFHGLIVTSLLWLARGIHHLFSTGKSAGLRIRTRKEKITFDLVMGGALAVLVVVVGITTHGTKIWANGLVILASVALSLLFVVEWFLDVPIAGSKLLFLAGTTLYLFFASALGVFLGTIARSMAQFALLVLLVVLPLALLSGGMTPVDSQPAWLQPVTFLLPSRHFVSFSQGILFRGAGFDIVWPEFLTVTVLGLAFFGASLTLFQRSISIAE